MSLPSGQDSSRRCSIPSAASQKNCLGFRPASFFSLVSLLTTGGSAPHLPGVSPQLAPRALGSLVAQALDAGVRLFGGGNSRIPDIQRVIWRGDGESPNLNQCGRWVGTLCVFTGNLSRALHGELVLLGKESQGWRQAPGPSPTHASSQSGGNWRPGSPFPLLTTQCRLCGSSGGFLPIWSLQPCLGWNLYPFYRCRN